jgi:cell division transport system permease protein
MHALRYAIDEALASVWRGRSSGLLATVTIALALFVLGGFLLVTSNLRRLSAGWGNAAEISVYLKDEIAPAERGAIENLLTSGSLVTSREYVSKDEALKRFKQTFGELGAAVDGTGDNPLPASYEARLRTGPDVRERVDQLATELRQLSGVADVRYDRQWLERLQAAITVISGVGLVLGFVLTIAAALTVANVVRLALYARRDELEIMELVGAPDVYIRGPFVMEGILQGGSGALLALIALVAGFVVVRARYLAPLTSAVDVSAIRFLPAGLCVLLVVGGMALGCVGALVAARHRNGQRSAVS